MPGPNERRYSRNECGTGGDGEEEGVAFMKLNLHCCLRCGYGNRVKTIRVREIFVNTFPA